MSQLPKEQRAKILRLLAAACFAVAILVAAFHGDADLRAASVSAGLLFLALSTI